MYQSFLTYNPYAIRTVKRFASQHTYKVTTSVENQIKHRIRVHVPLELETMVKAAGNRTSATGRRVPLPHQYLYLYSANCSRSSTNWSWISTNWSSSSAILFFSSTFPECADELIEGPGLSSKSSDGDERDALGTFLFCKGWPEHIKECNEHHKFEQKLTRYVTFDLKLRTLLTRPWTPVFIRERPHAFSLFGSAICANLK